MSSAVGIAETVEFADYLAVAENSRGGNHGFANEPGFLKRRDDTIASFCILEVSSV